MEEAVKDIDLDSITFDPSRDEVLGVFDSIVHVRVNECVLLIPKIEYLRVWENYLTQKEKILKGTPC